MLTRPRRPGMAHLNSSTLLSPCEDSLLCGDEESGTRFGGRVADPCLLCWRACLTLRCTEEWAPPARMNVCGASGFPVLGALSIFGGRRLVGSTIGELDPRGPQ
jgi:hypothetical protein